MPEYTVGEFVTALGGIIGSLNGLADDLSHCNLETDIEKTPGRKVICQVPVMGGSECRLKGRVDVKASDLVEAIAALSLWAKDIRSTLDGVNPAEPLFPGPPPPADLEDSPNA